MENITDVRVKRAEQDIETLRKTQSALLDRYDIIYQTMQDMRDVVLDNRNRLERVEDRLKLLEDIVLENRDIMRQNRDGIRENRKMLQENRKMVLENRKMILENRDIILENRNILFAIADHLDLTLETPPPNSQPD